MFCFYVTMSLTCLHSCCCQFGNRCMQVLRPDLASSGSDSVRKIAKKLSFSNLVSVQYSWRVSVLVLLNIFFLTRLPVSIIWIIFTFIVLIILEASIKKINIFLCSSLTLWRYPKPRVGTSDSVGLSEFYFWIFFGAFSWVQQNLKMTFSRCFVISVSRSI